MLIGYARVSTDDQKLDLQMDALARAGVDSTRIYTDRASGMRSDRSGLSEALRAVREGDVLVIWRLDRFARSTAELLRLWEQLQHRGVVLRSLNESIDSGSATGKLVYTVIAAMAEFERNLISERTVAGMLAARSKGARVGRPPALTDKQCLMAEALLDKMSGKDVAEQLGVHRVTLYRALKGYRERQSSKSEQGRRAQ